MTARRTITCLLLLWLSLAAVGYLAAGRTALDSLRLQLTTELPGHIVATSPDGLLPETLLVHLAQRMNADLERLIPVGLMPLLSSCSARIVQLQDRTVDRLGNREADIMLRWDVGPIRQAAFRMHCKVAWVPLLSVSLLLALATALLWRWLPQPLSSRRREWVGRLVEAGSSLRAARGQTGAVDELSDVQWRLAGRLATGGDPLLALQRAADPRCAALDAAGLDWFELGLQQHAGDIEAALAVAQAPAQLELSPGDFSVRCHGVDVRLSSTPFIYLYWYAQRRQQGDGWFTNPHPDRPNLAVRDELVELMTCHGVHARAIRDLQEKGLRARTLDQNRSKIKEELTAVLGEELASCFLFEQARDHRTGRNRYRLAVPPDRLVLR